VCDQQEVVCGLFLHQIRIYSIEFAAFVRGVSNWGDFDLLCLPKHRLRSVDLYQQATTAVQATPSTLTTPPTQIPPVSPRLGVHWITLLGLVR
jgi:hypothetical protein